MKISYLRTGGFAGMVMSFSFDNNTLSSDDIVELDHLLAAADFFELPSKITSEAPAVDQFQYTITVESDKRQHTVDIGEGAIPETLWPLLNKLRVLSRSTRNQ